MSHPAADRVVGLYQDGAEGWIADRSMLDDYLNYLWEPPNEGAEDRSTTQTA